MKYHTRLKKLEAVVKPRKPCPGCGQSFWSIEAGNDLDHATPEMQQAGTDFVAFCKDRIATGRAKACGVCGHMDLRSLSDEDLRWLIELPCGLKPDQG